MVVARALALAAAWLVIGWADGGSPVWHPSGMVCAGAGTSRPTLCARHATSERWGRQTVLGRRS